MTGPEHYREAERLLLDCDKRSGDMGMTVAEIMANVAAGQVHATLALAAATAQQGRGEYPIAEGWRDVVLAPQVVNT